MHPYVYSGRLVRRVHTTVVKKARDSSPRVDAKAAARSLPGIQTKPRSDTWIVRGLGGSRRWLGRPDADPTRATTRMLRLMWVINEDGGYETHVCLRCAVGQGGSEAVRPGQQWREAGADLCP